MPILLLILLRTAACWKANIEILSLTSKKSMSGSMGCTFVIARRSWSRRNLGPNSKHTAQAFSQNHSFQWFSSFLPFANYLFVQINWDKNVFQSKLFQDTFDTIRICNTPRISSSLSHCSMWRKTSRYVLPQTCLDMFLRWICLCYAMCKNKNRT